MGDFCPYPQPTPEEEIYAAEERGYEIGILAASKLAERLYQKWSSAGGFENYATAAKKISADILLLKVRLPQAAEADIAAHEKVVLAEPVWNVFFDALNKPPEANANLKALLKRT